METLTFMPEVVGQTAQDVLITISDQAVKAHPFVMQTADEEEDIEPYREFDGEDMHFLGLGFLQYFDGVRIALYASNALLFALSIGYMAYNYLFIVDPYNIDNFLSVSAFPMIAIFLKMWAYYLEDTIWLIDEDTMAQVFLYSLAIGF